MSTQEHHVSKSRFKARALEYLRRVEVSGRELVITDRGQPVCKVVRYVPDPLEALANLRGTVLRYDGPTDPVAAWEAAD